ARPRTSIGQLMNRAIIASVGYATAQAPAVRTSSRIWNAIVPTNHPVLSPILLSASSLTKNCVTFSAISLPAPSTFSFSASQNSPNFLTRSPNVMPSPLEKYSLAASQQFPVTVDTSGPTSPAIAVAVLASSRMSPVAGPASASAGPGPAVAGAAAAEPGAGEGGGGPAGAGAAAAAGAPETRAIAAVARPPR